MHVREYHHPVLRNGEANRDTASHQQPRVNGNIDTSESLRPASDPEGLSASNVVIVKKDNANKALLLHILVLPEER